MSKNAYLENKVEEVLQLMSAQAEATEKQTKLLEEICGLLGRIEEQGRSNVGYSQEKLDRLAAN